MRPFIRQRGIGLLSLGVSVMVLGVGLEIAASRITKRRKKHQSLSDSEILEREAFLQ